jgi:hypothetical protein
VTEDIKPNLQGSIPARVEYRYVCKSSDGTPLIAHGKTIFGRSIYNFTAIALTVDEAQTLLRSVDSFKEQ